MKGLIQWYLVPCFLVLSFQYFHVDSSLPTLSFNSSAPTKLCPHDQSFALIQFKNSISIDCFASVVLWPVERKEKTITWKEGTSCCLWDGVKCEAETGNVIGLDLSCSCLRGTITSNSSLFFLHHLQELNLAFNDFSSSPIASQFGQFTNLTHLNISYSGFTGTIPLQISHLSKLLSLDLSDSAHNLIFESHVFEKVLENLTQLQHLLLDRVNMSSVVPTSFLNMSSYITILTLEDNGLKGKFPEDFFRFPCLQMFSLFGNDLEIIFPKFNWSAPLRSLQISSTYFHQEIPVLSLKLLGELPDSIGDLRLLEVLYLSYIQLKGSIPATVGNLTRLSNLYIEDTNLEGPIIDAFGNLTKLCYLSLKNNNLNGQLPFSAFNLPQIESLDFSGNKFVGPLPNHVSGLSRLRELGLASNFLSGKIPSWLFSLPSLVSLDLRNNKLAGPIEQINKVGPLMTVYLQNNEIHGPIPGFTKLVNLTVLYLSSNKLNGSFELDKMPNKLGELDLSNNTFISLTSGSKANYSLPSLQYLNLSSCNIIEVPDVVRYLPGLVGLELSHNGALSISNNSNVSLVLPNLSSLSLSSCKITQFPNFLTSLDSLTQLDLSNNIIQGQISKEETKWGKNLVFLDLSRNFLTVLEYYPWRNIETLFLGSNLLEGPLLVPPPSTQNFVISKNKLVGEIPSSICNLVRMEILDLSNNSLSGAIPECLNSGDMKLSVLDLHMNKFNGNIPNIFPDGNTLRTLQLNNNDFDGPLPKSLENCQNLEVLNLGNNKINGTFPHWLGTLPQLQVLVLRANHLDGQFTLSKNESHFSSLRILDLSHNEFSGFLPTSCFRSFKSMMNLSDVQMGYMGDNGYYQDSVVVTMKGIDIQLERILTIFTTIDMSNNKFQGKIPEIVGKLTSLLVLNFSHNKLTGHIPSSFGDLAALESLDVSSNKLVGEIPMQLASLNFLAALNLSQNQLVGQIPQGKQFNTFLNDSYEGNLGLCGFPLSKRCGPDEPPAPPVFHRESDSDFGLDWKFVLAGYGCGLVFGFSAGYIMLTLQKPKWLVKRVQQYGNKVLRRLRRYR